MNLSRIISGNDLSEEKLERLFEAITVDVHILNSCSLRIENFSHQSLSVYLSDPEYIDSVSMYVTVYRLNGNCRYEFSLAEKLPEEILVSILRLLPEDFTIDQLIHALEQYGTGVAI